MIELLGNTNRIPADCNLSPLEGFSRILNRADDDIESNTIMIFRKVALGALCYVLSHRHVSNSLCHCTRNANRQRGEARDRLRNHIKAYVPHCSQQNCTALSNFINIFKLTRLLELFCEPPVVDSGADNLRKDMRGKDLFLPSSFCVVPLFYVLCKLRCSGSDSICLPTKKSDGNSRSKRHNHAPSIPVHDTALAQQPALAHTIQHAHSLIPLWIGRHSAMRPRAQAARPQEASDASN